MTRSEFGLSIAYLSKALGRTMDRTQTEIWFDSLSDIPAGDFEVGVRRFVRDGDGFPQPSKLREFCRINTASSAWIQVANAIRKWGAYRSIAFDDTKIHVVVRTLGGWRRFCDQKSDQMPFLKREFEKEYDRQPDDYPATLGRPLIGIENGDILNVNTGQTTPLITAGTRPRRLTGGGQC